MEKRKPFSFHAIIRAGVSLVTLTAHFMTSAVSSDTTRSTHLRLGSLSLRICFLTIASKARSGVKSPVLRGHGVRLRFVRGGKTEGDRQKFERKIGQTGRKKREEIKREVLVQLVICSCCKTNQAVEKDKPQVLHSLFLDKPIPLKIGQCCRDRLIEAKLQLTDHPMFCCLYEMSCETCSFSSRDQRCSVLNTSRIHNTPPITTLHNTTALPAHRAHGAGLGQGHAAQNFCILVSRDFSRCYPEIFG